MGDERSDLLRANIGLRDIQENQVELIRRDTKERFYVKEKELVNQTLSILQKIQLNLLDSAKKHLRKNTRTATSLEELLSVLDATGGFVACSWCGKRRMRRSCEGKDNSRHSNTSI